ncbi:MAG: hypothetical protein IIB77_02360 [Proteobacteria bacterium]|nr:hypothetical protein [Pseudomonadota bacterium]
MSKVVKGVKKVFKKIVKAVVKIAPILLAVAAIYFTAGAVLSLPGASIGIGGAVNTITAGLGEGILGGVVRGALTAAAKSAAIGGIVSKATGGSFKEGAKAGAVTGLIVGGVSGGFSAARTGSLTKSGVKTFPLPDQLSTAPMQALDATGKAVQTQASAGLFQKGGWLERNQDLAGNVIAGVGSGLLAGSAADADRDYLREKFRLTGENYAGTDPGRNYRDLARGTARQPSTLPRPTPALPPPPGSAVQPGSVPRGGLDRGTERYDPRDFGSFEYQYSPKEGRIIKVPVA